MFFKKIFTNCRNCMARENYVQAFAAAGKIAQTIGQIVRVSNTGARAGTAAARAGTAAARAGTTTARAGTATARAGQAARYGVNAAEIGLTGVGIAGMAGAFDPTYDDAAGTEQWDEIDNSSGNASARAGDPSGVISCISSSSYMSICFCCCLMMMMMMV